MDNIIEELPLMKAYTNMIPQIQKLKFSNVNKNQSSSQFIHHYTTAARFSKIVKEGRIRFSRVETFEDETEGNLLVYVYRSILDDLHNSRIIEKTLYDNIIELSPSNEFIIIQTTQREEDGLMDFERLNPECDLFALCFSKDFDNDFMWRHVCGKSRTIEDMELSKELGCDISGPVNITMDRNKLINCCNNIHFNMNFGNAGCKIYCTDICYPDDSIMETHVKEQIELVNKLLVSNVIEMERASWIIQYTLNYANYCYKGNQFKDEDECRVLIAIPKNQDVEGTGMLFDKDRNGLFVPLTKKIVHYNVQISPYNDSGDAILIRDLMESNNFKVGSVWSRNERLHPPAQQIL
jgi:hypothetical protein